MHPLDLAVSALMREVAREIVMPSFRALAAADMSEKTPGDFVTIADRRAEERLAGGLVTLLPEAAFVGEEGVAAEPALLDLVTSGAVWIVDPLDGTNNYAAGREPFAIMVALARDGEVEAGWILDPVSGRMLHAARGAGAFVDGERIVARPSGAEPPIAALALRLLPAERRDDLSARAAGRLAEIPIPFCAGEQYARLVRAENDIALYARANDWDHAAGSLILEEAGGRLARFDGERYQLGQNKPGLLAAATPALWDRAAQILFG